MSFGINNVNFRSRVPAGNFGQLSNIWNAGKIQSVDIENDDYVDGDQIYYSETRNLWVTGPIPSFFGATGSCAEPTYSFDADRNTGMLLEAADHLAFASGGVCQVGIASTGVHISPQVLAFTGTAAAPQYSFVSDPNSGMFHNNADHLGFAVGGTSQVEMASTGVNISPQVLAFTGTAAAPQYSFTSDPNSGMFLNGVDNIGFSTGGAIKMDIDTNSLNLASGVTFIGQTSTATGSTAGTAIPLTDLICELTLVADGGGENFTLATGTDGQLLKLAVVSGATATTLNTTNIDGPGTITFDAVGETLDLVYIGTTSKWYVMGSFGTTLA